MEMKTLRIKFSELKMHALFTTKKLTGNSLHVITK